MDWMAVRVVFACKNPSLSIYIPIMADLFFATYGELILLAKAWKMHGSLSNIVGNMMIGTSSNRERTRVNPRHGHGVPSRYVRGSNMLNEPSACDWLGLAMLDHDIS